MKLFPRLKSAGRLAPHLRAAVAEYRSLTHPPDDTRLAEIRLVIVDVETSGLDPYRDRLISLGAVGLSHRLVQFEDSFKVVLRQPHASSEQNIVVHGIDGTTQLAGTDPADALVAWLAFSRAAPLVGFHAAFDRVMLARAMQQALGIEPTNSWFDVATLLPALFPAHRASSLDEWAKLFFIENRARHDALSDAVATAQLLQVALAEAARQGIETVRALADLEKNHRWLMQSMRG